MTSLQQPLRLRGESGLPQGGPVDRGLPLDSGIPGSRTFVKPVDDIREPRTDDESIHRIDGPDDLLKDPSRIEVREDNADKHDGIGGWGKGESDPSFKTKYPYRDDRRHTKMALRIARAYVIGLGVA